MRYIDKLYVGSTRGTILLAVTADVSLGLMQGFPEYLAGQGWNVHVVSSPGPRSQQLGEVSSVHMHAFPMERNPSPFRDLCSLFAWLRLLRSVRPDVVTSGTPKAGLLGMLAAWVLRVPDRVYIVRGLRLETTTGILRRLLTLMEKLTFAFSTRAIAVSPSLLNEVVELRLVKAEKISVTGLGSSNGVDTQRFHPRDANDAEIVTLSESLGLRDDLPTIGFVGRLNIDKGLGMLRAALRTLNAESNSVQLLLIGGQDGAAAVGNGSFGEHVHVVKTGQVTDTSKYYPLMDMLCLPTRREGFPNVVLEAAASGVPTVTTNATGAIDSVIDGETGLIVDKDDPDALARALGLLASDKDLRDAMGTNARAWVVKHFEQTAVWNRTNDFLAVGSIAHNRMPASGARKRD